MVLSFKKRWQLLSQMRRWLRWISGASVFVLFLSGVPGHPMPSASAQNPPEWLTALNAYRASSGLGPVEVDAALLVGVRNHIAYMASTGTLTHNEEPGRTGYTAEGAAAAKRGVLAAAMGIAKSERQMIEDWLSGPFHSLPLLDANLRTAAFSSVTTPQSGPFASLGMLDIGTRTPTSLSAPVVFPGRGATVSRATRTIEFPNSLSHCPGYSEPAGLAMVALFAAAPSGASGSLTANGASIEVCVVDSSYRNTNASEQQIGRLLLSQQNAVFMIPKRPLSPGTKYDATIDAGPAGATSWSFTIGPPDAPLPTASSESAVSATPPAPSPVANPASSSATTKKPVAKKPVAKKPVAKSVKKKKTTK